MEIWSYFSEIPEQDFSELVGSIVDNKERINTTKSNTINMSQCSKC